MFTASNNNVKATSSPIASITRASRFYFGRTGNVEQAEFYFERAENIEATEAEAKLRHGELLVREGKYSAALPFLRRANDLQPKESIKKYIEQVERAAR